jgi:integrase
MREKAAETVVLKKNAIRLVRRADSERWQAHYKVAGLHGWIRKATGESDLEKATEIAEDFWRDAKVLAKKGYPVVSKKFKAVAEVVLKNLEIKVAADKTKRGSNNDYISALNNYLIPFFGPYNIDCITQRVFTDFCEWRRLQVGRELSHSAQLNHNAAMSLVLDYGVERGYLTTMQKPVLKNTGEVGSRRPDFSQKEVETIVAHLPAWVLKARKGASHNLRELLAVYVPFAAATGMRTGTEMDGLEWRHIEIREIGENKEPVLYAHIQKGKTVKKNKPMGAVLHRSCWLYLEKLRAMSPEFDGKTLEEVLAERHPLQVFRMRDGKQPNQLTKQFKNLLVELDLLTCPITGEERTLYSLRHYAITQLVAKGVTAEQMQQQVRTSAPMISKHYNHMQPMQNAETFSGQNDGTSGDEIARIINGTFNDNLVQLAEMSTGLNMALVMINKPATDKLRDELSKAVSGTAA